MRLIGFFILMLPHFVRAQFVDIPLDNWWFSEVGKQNWLPAKVPGTVHTDLFALGKIANPYADTSESSLQWIEERDWVYRTTFTCSPEILKQDHVELTFAGLDTYAEVVLNKKTLLSASNAYRTYTIDVKSLLENHNTLTITFKSAVKEGIRLAKKLPYELPGKEGVFTRKPPYEFGWDWAPRYVTCGITGAIKLVGWSNFKVRHLNVRTLMIRHDTAFMELTAKVASDSTRLLHLFVSKDFPFKDSYKEMYTLLKGENSVTFNFQIPQAKLWWCNGLGAPYLYNYFYQFQYKNRSASAGNFRFGVRTIELMQQPDSAGTSFFFKLNNQPIFIKGANYIPLNSFLPNVRWKQLDSLMQTVKNTHMNMIRVWGGGGYGSDWLYEICDRYGILIWQDFPFACAMYPGDKGFLENITTEATEHIERLKGHPSLALWCGNNESDEGWHNWGWQKEFHYSKKDSTAIYNDYKKIFHNLLPDLVRKISPEIAYIPSSPQYGWGRNKSYTNGDSHYWGVWWGFEPFENYSKKVPRFASEYGFQGLPNISSFDNSGAQPLSLQHPVVKAHQKHPRGFETIHTYLIRDYLPTDNFAKYIYLSQLVQRDGMRIAITAHRTNRNYCMGTLFWQLNDCWPGTSWSAIDYYGRKKAFAYDLNQLYAPLFTAITADKNATNIILVNDSTASIEAKLQVYWLNFKGDTLAKQQHTATVNKFEKSTLSINHPNDFVIDSTSNYLLVMVSANGKMLSTTRHFYQKPKFLNLPPAQISIKPIGSGVYEILSNRFVKDVCLYLENQDIYSNNFFDLEPHTPYRITLPGAAGKKIEVFCLNNLYQE